MNDFLRVQLDVFVGRVAFFLILFIRRDAKALHRAGDVRGSIDTDLVPRMRVELTGDVVGANDAAMTQRHFALDVVLRDLLHVKLPSVRRQADDIHAGLQALALGIHDATDVSAGGERVRLRFHLGEDVGGGRRGGRFSAFRMQQHVRFGADERFAELALEALHHGADHDHRRDTDHDAENGDDRDDGDERTLRTQVAAGEEERGVRRHGAHQSDARRSFEEKVRNGVIG